MWKPSPKIPPSVTNSIETGHARDLYLKKLFLHAPQYFLTVIKHHKIIFDY